MEGHCSTGQSPQWVVVPMEEEEKEKKEKKKKSSKPRNADRVGRRQRESGCHSSASRIKTSDVKLSVTLRLIISQYFLVLSPTRVSQTD